MEMKKCGRCKRELPLDMFYKNKSEKDGLSWHCKDCSKEIAFARKDKIKKYNEEHRKEKSIYNKRYNDKHREERAEKQRQYRKENKEKEKEYKAKNKERMATYHKQYQNQRMASDDLYNFKQTIRSTINQSFKRRKLSKSHKTEEIICCSLEQLKEHLHKTFFANYGYEYDGKEDVHIDHIVPLATANTEEDVIKLCHYTNLQLLKAKDNLEKGCKMPLLTK